jgi:large subunit ribosomal protein L21e
MKRSHGPRQNTRDKLKKPARARGKLSTTKLIQKLKPGEKVVIKPEPAIQKSLPFRRFIGKVGVVKGTRGKSFLVNITDGNKEKTIICKPIHLKKV